MATARPLKHQPAHILSRSARMEAAGYDEEPTPVISNTHSTRSTSPSGDVTVSLNYFRPPEDGSVPFNFVESPPEGVPQRNYTDHDLSVPMHDIRGKESDYNLDKDAFAVIQNVCESKERHFTDDASIEKNYYPELEKLILDNVKGTNRVVFFDHTIRRAQEGANRMPVTRVHIDQTAKSARERVVRHLGADAEKLLQGRFRIINVWRPLNGPVISFPLGFASSESVENSDLIPIEHRYPERTGETAGVVYNEAQKWHYLSKMENNERLLLECFDSEALKDGSKVKGGRVPHTAFIHPGTPEGAPGRESIEVRALVFGP